MISDRYASPDPDDDLGAAWARLTAELLSYLLVGVLCALALIYVYPSVLGWLARNLP